MSSAGPPGFDEFEEMPTSAWNYALSVDEKEPGKSVELLKNVKDSEDANPFTPATTPVMLSASAQAAGLGPGLERRGRV